MTPCQRTHGVATAGHAGSYAWGDCVSHQRLRATVQRSSNQESHGVSRVECQIYNRIGEAVRLAYPEGGWYWR